MFTFCFRCTSACVVEIYRRRKRPQISSMIALALCLLIAWTSMQAASDQVVGIGPTPSAVTAHAPSPPLQGSTGSSSSSAAISSAEGRSSTLSSSTVGPSLHRLAVTIRSQHTGKYWQVLSEGSSGRYTLSASAAPNQRGMESTVFLLEREGGDSDADGWVLLRWLKTRQAPLPPLDSRQNV